MTANNHPNRIEFLLRSATGDLADLRRQRKLLEKEFVRRGFDLSTCSLEIYRDTHQSGLRPGPEFQRMSRDVATGKLDVVMVSRMNRISRKFTELLKFYKFLETHRIRFISAEENVDSITSHSMQRAVDFGGVR